MCGIAGIYQKDLDKKEGIAGVINRMANAIRHRGPDGDIGHI